MTALHEAAHAVAHLRLHQRLYLGKVTIVPDHETAGLGQFEELTSESEDDWGKEVVVLCAGYAAQLMVGDDPKRARLGASSDLEKAEQIILGWGLPALIHHINTATKLLEVAENRRAVDRIAAELLEHDTLDSDDVEILLMIADGEASEADYERFKLLRTP